MAVLEASFAGRSVAVLLSVLEALKGYNIWQDSSVHKPRHGRRAKAKGGTHQPSVQFLVTLDVAAILSTHSRSAYIGISNTMLCGT